MNSCTPTTRNGSRPFDEEYARLAAQKELGRRDLVKLLSASTPEQIEAVRAEAERVLLAHCGDGVFLRGLVEASNACACDCLYCGIRKSNRDVNRYTLSLEDILACARQCADYGYGSMVIQSGERADKKFVDLVAEAVARIKTETRTDKQPDGLGITLCIGQQSYETYKRLYDAGAHRYLLRIETTNPALFAKIHPADQTFESRVACLKMLRDIGYQVGTGVMIGLPGQTLEDLADDILFFSKMDIDMIGMGPFIPHPDTPLWGEPVADVPARVQLALLMIAATRLKLRDVNIASTTALQALDPVGREKGLKFGANVIMPQMSPTDVRADYQLYPGKPCLDENAKECQSCLNMRIEFAGRKIGLYAWGDSQHAVKRLKSDEQPD
ncbi:[FeFe] hydrogenase H-cluster radical SAM maturase HydE [Rhizomicrobium electricum]|uniref:[FeFe] hydrogenase H-cluster radical SAM maturase HydE n=1 Tax=Rhizomicrobium electricum TaxID=480070 RepID=UPI00141ED626|nr:[FeFe] hydrogenase H-cluster radical SAM maturase HydE [Rhizomicrobium electricum]NIJ49664.1 biotin synthase [Rhizomicrobium electricum]